MECWISHSKHTESDSISEYCLRMKRQKRQRENERNWCDWDYCAAIYDLVIMVVVLLFRSRVTQKYGARLEKSKTSKLHRMQNIQKCLCGHLTAKKNRFPFIILSFVFSFAWTSEFDTMKLWSNFNFWSTHFVCCLRKIIFSEILRSPHSHSLNVEHTP